MRRGWEGAVSQYETMPPPHIMDGSHDWNDELQMGCCFLSDWVSVARKSVSANNWQFQWTEYEGGRLIVVSSLLQTGFSSVSAICRQNTQILSRTEHTAVLMYSSRVSTWKTEWTGQEPFIAVVVWRADTFAVHLSHSLTLRRRSASLFKALHSSVYHMMFYSNETHSH